MQILRPKLPSYLIDFWSIKWKERLLTLYPFSHQSNNTFKNSICIQAIMILMIWVLKVGWEFCKSNSLDGTKGSFDSLMAKHFCFSLTLVNRTDCEEIFTATVNFSCSFALYEGVSAFQYFFDYSNYY